MDIQKGRAVRLKTLDLSRARKDGDAIAKAMEVAGFEGVKKYVQEQLGQTGIGIGKEGVITLVCNDHLVKVKFLGIENEVFVPTILLVFTGRMVGQHFTLNHKLGMPGMPGTFVSAGTHLEFAGAVIEDVGAGVLGIMNCFSILDGEYKGKTLRFAPGSSAEWSLKEG
ncbi:MAG: hypothetical protein HZB51_16575 [Chloroflexi bacterium]|nr:hypothetical protein [Chloroflexota bacterium]